MDQTMTFAANGETRAPDAKLPEKESPSSLYRLIHWLFAGVFLERNGLLCACYDQQASPLVWALRQAFFRLRRCTCRNMPSQCWTKPTPNTGPIYTIFLRDVFGALARSYWEGSGTELRRGFSADSRVTTQIDFGHRVAAPDRSRAMCAWPSDQPTKPSALIKKLIFIVGYPRLQAVGYKVSAREADLPPFILRSLRRMLRAVVESRTRGMGPDHAREGVWVNPACPARGALVQGNRERAVA